MWKMKHTPLSPEILPKLLSFNSFFSFRGDMDLWSSSPAEIVKGLKEIEIENINQRMLLLRIHSNHYKSIKGNTHGRGNGDIYVEIKEKGKNTKQASILAMQFM